MNVLSVASGIGGLELAVKLVIPEARVVAFVEREAYAQAILLARMEDETLEPAPIWSDKLERFDALPFAGLVDLLTAGLPCQPYSSAGTRQGNEDERALWPELARIVSECRPALVFLENVPAWVTSGGFRPLGEELSRLGYKIADPFFIAAEDIGATHIRERVFVLAYADGAGFGGAGSAEPENNGAEVAHSDGRGLTRLWLAGLWANADGRYAQVGCARQYGGQGSLQRESAAPLFHWPPDPSDRGGWEAVEDETLIPSFRRVASGIPDRLDPYAFAPDRIRCLGNAVVPQCAAVAFGYLLWGAGLIDASPLAVTDERTRNGKS